jgi:hypothetical protein
MEKRLTAFLVCLILTIGTAFAQDSKITGTIISQEDGEPVIGASVIINGTKNRGTVTNIDGQFTLNVKPGTKLKISAIGMKTVTVSAKNGMKVTLSVDDATSLDEVVSSLGKDDRVLIEGNLQITTVKNENGTERRIFEINANTVEPIGATSGTGNVSQPAKNSNSEDIVKFSQEEFSEELIGEYEIPF